MQDIDSGVMPIGENDRLVGMITDRAVTIRAIRKARIRSGRRSAR